MIQDSRHSLEKRKDRISLFLFFIYRSGVLIPHYHQDGLGLAGRTWHQSAAIQSLEELPPVPLYSNSGSTLYLWSGRPSYLLRNFEQLRESGAEQEAILVLFHHVPMNKDVDALTQGMELLQSDELASIYRLGP